MIQRLIVGLSLLIAVVSLSLLAAEKHGSHSSHAAADSEGFPKEGGEAAFAAIIEIVALLEADKDTDWSRVDIDGLRSHLLDMNALMRETEAQTTDITDTKIEFTVAGKISAMPAINSMVPAHARFIQQSRGWDINTQLSDTGAVVTINAHKPEDINRLNALGFYGYMSLDGHHQAHHHQMARGYSH